MLSSCSDDSIWDDLCFGSKSSGIFGRIKAEWSENHPAMAKINGQEFEVEQFADIEVEAYLRKCNCMYA